ncbi:exopolysaccharide biosynthesis polyprenyl glycosylphosphotransferase [Flavobacterium restrictum]|uniref:Exopolysaccharide biosynthesis polyprenyl glycosylphosphotransferase n=1 Tax=Flavobacterium restrictum TaxID=2594428 RepID=A0A553E5R9_9FLAO|nr:exopolysaccharide biosynthesis polyprenyl glycosylphosphotransferase [Flavobacterium restrictum]TRX40396.1 exopolysaccharide biosynthesis polyprenyl glycosylphosphotransferase [Flavobacterium restrictum]
MRTKTGRYSGYIRPFSYIIDLIIINVLALYVMPFHNNPIYYACFVSLAWFIIAANLGFYEVYRYTKVIAILNCAGKQWFLFVFFCLVLEYFYSEIYNQKSVVLFTALTLFLVLIIKLFIYFFLRQFRVLFGGNSRSVVLLGNTKNTNPLEHFFLENPDYGYNLVKVFPLEDQKEKQIDSCLSFVLSYGADEIYCATADLSESQITAIIDFADNNLKTLKFIPNEKQILSRNEKFEYYDYIPIVSLRNILQDETLNKIIKRIFDFLFSLGVIVFLLSWLMPILAIIIKWESKGPLFFIQKRNGLNYKEFNCYKFRSMEINDNADVQIASKNDDRITKVGKFIRKTSIDELPQFFNVLWGDMSVVGPRPHMVSVTNLYALQVDKFMVRHFVKPGITGLAQTKGFRGEVETDEDIINRVKYDIFYMENWSILLDIKIIFNTIVNIITGDEKAY